MNILSIQPFLKSYRLYPVAGGKDKAASEIASALAGDGHRLFVLPLPWSGKKAASELIFERMPFILDNEMNRGEVLPTAFFPSGRRLAAKAASALFREGGWRKPKQWFAEANKMAVAETRQAVVHALREVRFDLVHNHQSASNAPLLFREAGYRGPMVLTNHSALLSPFLDEYDRLVFVSKHQRDRAIARIPKLAEKSHVIHYYADLEYFMPLEPSVSNEMVFIGILDTPRKGLGIVLETLAGFPELGRCQLHVIGEGAMLEDHRAFARKNGLNVRFHGRIPHSRNAEIMSRAGLYLMPSLGEGMALTYLEALCMGLPLIGYPPNVLELEELLEMKIGFPYDAERDSKESLRELILLALDPDGPFPPDHRKRFSANARRFFSRDRFRKKQLEFHHALERGGLP